MNSFRFFLKKIYIYPIFLKISFPFVSELKTNFAFSLFLFKKFFDSPFYYFANDDIKQEGSPLKNNNND